MIISTDYGAVRDNEPLYNGTYCDFDHVCVLAKATTAYVAGDSTQLRRRSAVRFPIATSVPSEEIVVSIESVRKTEDSCRMASSLGGF